MDFKYRFLKPMGLKNYVLAFFALFAPISLGLQFAECRLLRLVRTHPELGWKDDVVHLRFKMFMMHWLSDLKGMILRRRALMGFCSSTSDWESTYDTELLWFADISRYMPKV